MQVDKPKPLPRDLREFAGEYAMIVISILTALALEHLVVDWQNHEAAAASVVRIRAELSRNLSDLENAETRNQASVGKVNNLLQRLLTTLKAGQKPATDLALDLAAISHDFGVSLPTWQRSAWDTAIADRSAEYIETTTLSRMALAYAEADDTKSVAQILLGGDWITNAAGLGVAIATGTVDEHQRAALLLRYLIAATEIASTQRTLETDIKSALAGK